MGKASIITGQRAAHMRTVIEDIEGAGVTATGRAVANVTSDLRIRGRGDLVAALECDIEGYNQFVEEHNRRADMLAYLRYHVRTRNAAYRTFVRRNFDLVTLLDQYRGDVYKAIDAINYEMHSRRGAK
jgi:hypothetical protein